MNSNTNKQLFHKNDERGMAAIMITMVIMSVIALIVLGFAAISRREQRMALDKQLQTQAFYAAESGVNDAIKIIKANTGEAAQPVGGPFTWTSAGASYASCSGACVVLLPYVLSASGDTITPTYTLQDVSEGPAQLTLKSSWLLFSGTTTVSISVNGVPKTTVQLSSSKSETVIDLVLPKNPATLSLSWGGMMMLNSLTLTGDGPVGGASDISKVSCNNTGLYASLDAVSTLASGVGYSCVLVDPHPKTLSYQGLGDVDSWIVPLTTKESSAPSDIKFTWWPSGSKEGNPKNDCKNEKASEFVPATGSSGRTCRYPVLRVDLVDIGDGSINITNDGTRSLNDHLSTFYFQPSTAGGVTSAKFNPSNKLDAQAPQAVLVSSCDSSTEEYGTCTVTVNGGTSPLTRNMAVRITSLYGASDVSVQALRSGNPMSLYDAQATVDVTGKAQDVLRRIQVHVPLQSASLSLPGALVSGGPVCKRYTTYANNFEINTTLKDPNNPLCP